MFLRALFPSSLDESKPEGAFAQELTRHKSLGFRVQGSGLRLDGLVFWCLLSVKTEEWIPTRPPVSTITFLSCNLLSNYIILSVFVSLSVIP